MLLTAESVAENRNSELYESIEINKRIPGSLTAYLYSFVAIFEFG